MAGYWAYPCLKEVGHCLRDEEAAKKLDRKEEKQRHGGGGEQKGPNVCLPLFGRG
jgi:hypothetical protein